MTDADLIVNGGLFESTGGRKAQIIQFNQRARAAVGMELLKDQVRIVAVDLYGSVLQEVCYPCLLTFDQQCMSQLGDSVNRFIESLPVPTKDILGVKIALQGLISPNGTAVTYSKIYPCGDLVIEMFQRYIHCPCSLIHDTEASAFAELWFYPELQDAVILMLNRYFGGALTLNRKVYQGREFFSGTLEHICMDPNGPECYCGRRGCLETFSSAYALERQAGRALPRFSGICAPGIPNVKRYGISTCHIWRGQSTASACSSTVTSFSADIFSLTLPSRTCACWSRWCRNAALFTQRPSIFARAAAALRRPLSAQRCC